MSITLRPHHGMCFRFYEGKGYSAAFTEHLGRLIDTLERDPQTPVRLTVGTDAVCERCPNNIGGVCETADKVARYDEAVLNACGLKDGDTLPYERFSDTIETKILAAGLRRTICGDCAWNGICERHT